jgi:integrase
MKWSEVDLERRLWSIPSNRRKGEAAHTVSLSDPAMEILQALPRFTSEFVFPARSGAHFSAYSRSKERLDQSAGVTGWRLHDIRRSVATKLQALGVRLEVVERILGHVSGSRSGIVGVYQRHRFDDEAAAALTLWARYLQSLIDPSAEEGKVVQLAR